jgi:hypothetical protein
MKIVVRWMQCVARSGHVGFGFAMQGGMKALSRALATERTGHSRL